MKKKKTRTRGNGENWCFSLSVSFFFCAEFLLHVSAPLGGLKRIGSQRDQRTSGCTIRSTKLTIFSHQSKVFSRLTNRCKIPFPKNYYIFFLLTIINPPTFTSKIWPPTIFYRPSLPLESRQPDSPKIHDHHDHDHARQTTFTFVVIKRTTGLEDVGNRHILKPFFNSLVVMWLIKLVPFTGPKVTTRS